MKRRLMTDKELDTAFLFFNVNFFDGKLQRPTVIKFADTGGDDGCLKGDAKGCYLLIHKGLQRFPDMAVVVLIHEMAHLNKRNIITQPGAHGMIFNAEIVRLFNAGAYENLL